MSETVLTIIRIILRALSAVSPRAAGRVAFWLFCHPTHARKVRPVQKAMQEHATELLDTAKVQKIRYDDSSLGSGEVCIYTFEPINQESPTGTVLLLHGWSSRATHMLAFVRPLQEQGQRVVAVDFPAHGNSSGRSFHLPMGVQVLHTIRSHTPAWTSIIAHSLGGAVATNLVSGGVKWLEPVSVNRLVLISAPNSIPEIFSQFSSMLGLNAAAEAVLGEHVIRLSGNSLDKFIARDQLDKAGIPTLVLHDPEDKEIPVKEAIALTQHSSVTVFKEVQNAGHRRILYSSAAVKLATEFCTQDNLQNNIG